MSSNDKKDKFEWERTWAGDLGAEDDPSELLAAAASEIAWQLECIRETIQTNNSTLAELAKTQANILKMGEKMYEGEGDPNWREVMK